MEDFPVLMRARLRHAAVHAAQAREYNDRINELLSYDRILFALGVYPQELGLIEGQVQ